MRKLILLPLLLVVGCGNDELPKYSEIGNLRILAMVADTPEVAPGSTVNIYPLITDIRGGDRTVNYTAVACLDPGVGYGASPSCDNIPFSQTVATNVTITDTAFQNPPRTGLLTGNDKLTVVVPGEDFVFAGKTDIEKFNGVPYLVTYKLTTSDGKTISSFKRILVSNKGTKNKNPDIKDIEDKDDNRVNQAPTEAKDYSPVMDETDAEEYSFKNADGGEFLKTETLTTTWFSSVGEFNRTRTEGLNTNFFQPPNFYSTDPGLIIVLVTRDGRGGADAIVKAY